MPKKHTEADLNLLIKEKIREAVSYSNVQRLAGTETGMERLVKRINEMILKEGQTDIDAAIGSVESELSFSESDN